MTGYVSRWRFSCVVLVTSLCACGTDATDETPGGEPPAAVRIATSVAVEQAIARFISVTGTLNAEEQADVAAEIAGRVLATPVERGTSIRVGTPLVRIAAAEAEAQAREADANAAQIQARLGQSSDDTFDVESVPEVASARATRDLARAELDRARALHERKLISQAEFDQSRARAENAARQYESARNGAEQQRQALAGARARVELARKALADTVVRAPFDGVVAERLVSVGDYVTRGTKVASVMRVNPLRVELTVPAQYIGAVGIGQPVTLTVDAYPDRTFTGRVRYISPSLQVESRALVVEAVVSNDTGQLKPGLFVTARIEQPSTTAAVLVPASAIRTVAGTARVFVVVGDRAEERIVTTGQTLGSLVEASTGITAGEVVAVSNVSQLVDGTRVVVTQ